MTPIRLRDFTTARVALGRTGASVPTRELLDFQLAHARARDAVYTELDVESMKVELQPLGEVVSVSSRAPDRQTYLRRPDLGRTLREDSEQLLLSRGGTSDVAFIAADGLSASAIHHHCAPLLRLLIPALEREGYAVAPIVLVKQGRVAAGDPIGYSLGASLAVVLIGERPGLSSPDSLGAYLTWAPKPGRTDADRNCVSNIHADGLSYEAAAFKLLFLIRESHRRKLSGVELKEESTIAGGSGLSLA